MVAVTLRGIGKRFGATQVLDGIDASFENGAFVVLVGKSGCGKSTLLRVIAGLEEVSAGTVEFGARDVTTLPPRDRDVAMVFQSYALYPHMTVRKNLAFGLELRHVDAHEIERRVAEVAKVLEIDHLLDRHPRALSGGQRQRVAMGRAIVRRPALFLFDEPLSNLDPSLRNHVRVDIRRLHDELAATSIYVTHDQVEAMTLADVLVVLDGGRIQQTGRPLDVYRRPANRFVAGFLGAPAMNMLPATVAADARAVVLRDGTIIAVPELESFGGLVPGREVDLGIRPHDLRVESTGALALTVELCETLGPSINLHGSISGAPFVAVIDGDAAPARGTTLRLTATVAHLFDRDSGVSLR